MNTKNAKVMSARAAKERKQKKLLLVLGVLFIVLVAFQGPRTLKKLHGSGSTTPAPSTSQAQAPASGTPASGTPASGTATPAAVTSSSSELPESDVPPVRKRSQLFSFELFDSKDPFVQQVSQEASGTAGTSTSSAAAPAYSAAPATATAAPASSSTTPTQQPAASSSASTAAAPKAAAAVIEVNGQRQAVNLSQAFPASNPTFKLVSVKGDLAMIGIAGGSFASGKGAIALRTGKALTLMNTSDGQRYELRLVSVR